MRYAILPEHREYFLRNGQVEFEKLLSEDEVAALKTAFGGLDRTRDLSRINPVFQKIARSARLANVAANLVGCEPLRLVYDEIFEVRAHSIAESCAFRELRCALLLCLDGIGSGNGVYLDVNRPLESYSLPLHPESLFWLIVYGEGSARYYLNPLDPYGHVPKRHGYVFGDALKNKDFPLVTRR